MTITGKMLIGSRSIIDHRATFRGINPATGEMMEPAFSTTGEAEVAQACALAAAASDSYRESSTLLRARFLDQIAENILALGDELIDRATTETGLGPDRLDGERNRTVAQLRMFGDVIRAGDWQGLRIDHAIPGRIPLRRPDLRLRRIALGPVAVFGASNFPLAFSVAGGDTASALAAGCPVVVKAHPAHPGTSELIGCAVQQAVMQMNLHEGVFSMLTGAGVQLGASLVADPHIKAVGFTGSRTGGLALMAIAAARQVPIPVYAEMSSINPVIVLPAALAARAGVIGKEFAAALMLGAGQFCTNPGLVLALAPDGQAFDHFLAAATAAVSASPAATMLTPGIHAAYQAQIKRLTHHKAVRQVAQGLAGAGPNQCQAHLMSIDAKTFLADPGLQAETFGAASMVIRCADLDTLQEVIAGLDGQLTATLQMDAQDLEIARVLLPLIEQKVGRIVVNGFPTGVEVAHAMVHGGPFPASSDGRSTSVGSLAIERFLRPVCYQDFPDALLPDPLKTKNLHAGVTQGAA